MVPIRRWGNCFGLSPAFTFDVPIAATLGALVAFGLENANGLRVAAPRPATPTLAIAPFALGPQMTEQRPGQTNFGDADLLALDFEAGLLDLDFFDGRMAGAVIARLVAMHQTAGVSFAATE